MSTADGAALLALGGRLMDIDEGRFRQVVGLLEHMADHPEVRRTFSLIRPRLAAVRPRRRPALKRLFCQPFEDLFPPFDPAAPKPPRTIERDLVNRLWPLVERHAGPERMAALNARLQSADGAPVALATIRQELWAIGAEATDHIARQAEIGRLMEELDARINPGRVAAVTDIAHLMAVAPELHELQELLTPKPLPKLHPDHLEGIRRLGRRVVRERPGALTVFVLAAAARLAEPARLLPALPGLDFGLQGAARAGLFLALGDGIVASIEEQAARMAADGAADGAAKAAGNGGRLAVADLAVHLAAGLEATRDALGATPRPEFEPRLKRVRAALHELVRAQVLDGAGPSILAALTPPTETDTGRERLLEAENHARALRKCSTVADGLGMRTEVRAVTDSTVASLSGAARTAFADSGGEPMRAGPVGFQAIRMVELIAGPAEANRIMTGILNTTRPL